MKVFNDWFGCFIDIYVITQLIVLYSPGVCLTCTSVSLSVKGTDTAVMSNQILTRPFWAWVAWAFVHYIWIRERQEKINYLLRSLSIAISHPEEGWGGRILVPSRQNLPDPFIVDSQYYYDPPPPPLYSVGDDWYPLRSPWKPCILPPPRIPSPPPPPPPGYKNWLFSKIIRWLDY